MSTYQCYKDARNAAWHALLQLRISTLPVDMNDVMEKLAEINRRIFRVLAQLASTSSPVTMTL